MPKNLLWDKLFAYHNSCEPLLQEIYFLQFHLGKHHSQVAKHQLTCNSQYDDAEEFTQDIQCGLSHILVEPIGAQQHKEQHYGIQCYRNHQIDNVILCGN